MAREFGLVAVSIWNSRKFTGLPTDDARLLYLYLLTCPSANSLGCFVLKSGYAAADLGWDQERFGYGIDTLCKASLIGIDTDESLVRIIGFLDHSEIMNVKHGAGALKVALTLPDCEQKSLLFKDLLGRKHLDTTVVQAEIDRLSHTVSIPYANGTDKPEPKPEPKPKEQQQPREALPEAGPLSQTDREKLLIAIGADPVSGQIGPNGRRLGTLADTEEAAKWSAMGLTLDQQCAVIAERCAAMRRKDQHWTPGRFAYFTGAMADLAAAKSSPVPTGTAKPQSERDAKLARYAKIAGQGAA